MDRSVPDAAIQCASDTLPPDIAGLVAEIETPAAGFFGPGSAMWTLSRERVLLLSGVSTILLQIAHPLVAAGVAEHSTFAEAPIGRFRRTFDRVHAIIFGDVDRAVAAALAVRSRHARITGSLSAADGPFPADEQYAASDPDLLLWVHATLIEQAMAAYEIYVAPLSTPEREAYYQEYKIFGQLLGVPEARYPETLAEFTAYYERMLTAELSVGPHASELQRTLFAQGTVCRPLFAFLGAGTLSEPVRDEFCLPWTYRRERLFDTGAAFIRTALPLLPSRLRYVDAYLRARARLSR